MTEVSARRRYTVCIDICKTGSAGGRPRRKEVHRVTELKEFWQEEDGVAVVEIVLILLVLIALVLIFKEQITKVLKSLMSKVSSQSDSV